ncbi:hypothetical protein PC120_g26831 [Phytophthora cactorum]|nr:hypothetical protein PC120_g26831 [Phytophthora cactorum]
MCSVFSKPGVLAMPVYRDPRVVVVNSENSDQASVASVRPSLQHRSSASLRRCPRIDFALAVPVS